MNTRSQDRTTPRHTTKTAAAALSISVPRVKQLAVELEVGTKLGRDWLFSDDDLDVMRRRPDRRRKEGRAA